MGTVNLATVWKFSILYPAGHTRIFRWDALTCYPVVVVILTRGQWPYRSAGIRAMKCDALIAKIAATVRGQQLGPFDHNFHKMFPMPPPLPLIDPLGT